MLFALIGESCSAFSATSCKDFSAVGVRHSLSEAVLHLSVTFLGLICSEHLNAPPDNNSKIRLKYGPIYRIKQQSIL